MKFLHSLYILYFCILGVISTPLHGESSPTLVQKHEAYLNQESLFQVQCALAAYRTLKADQIWYVSSPITSGKRLYDFMDNFHYASLEEARAHKTEFTQHVILPNIEEAEMMGRSISRQINGVVISPTSFEGQFRKQIASQWSDHTFMALWLSFIETKVTHIIMLDGWEYSNGASEEFLLASLIQQGFYNRLPIKILDARANPLSLRQGISLLENSIKEIEKHNISCPILHETINCLCELETHN